MIKFDMFLFIIYVFILVNITANPTKMRYLNNFLIVEGSAGDRVCDGFLNNEENNFDGGDCCGEDANLSYCFPQEGESCKCISKIFTLFVDIESFWTAD